MHKKEVQPQLWCFLSECQSVTAWSRLSGNGHNEGVISLADLNSGFLVIGGTQRLIQSAAVFIPCNKINSQDFGRNRWTEVFFFFSDFAKSNWFKDFWSTKSSKENGRVDAVVIWNSPIVPRGKGGGWAFCPVGGDYFLDDFSPVFLALRK